jgi:hypothetical protein
LKKHTRHRIRLKVKQERCRKNYSLNRLAASIAYQNRQYISELKIDNELLRRELDRMRNYLNVNKYDNHMDLDIDEPSIKM